MFAGIRVATLLEDATTADCRGDCAAAFPLFQSVAEDGDATARNHLAIMYRYGRGVTKGEAQAVQWYRSSAEQGCIDTAIGCFLGPPASLSAAYAPTMPLTLAVTKFAFRAWSRAMSPRNVQDAEARGACIASERRTGGHPFDRTTSARKTNIVHFRQDAYAMERRMKPTRLHMGMSAIARRIVFVRGQKVMLDADLAELYAVPTKRLNEQVKRNIERFPADFMFRLTAAEKAGVVANCDHLHKLKFAPGLPFVFTEHGALMLGNVLKSPRAVQVSLLIVRTFVQLRELLASHKELAAKLDELERKVSRHDKTLAGVIDAIRQLMRTPESPGRPIGFTADVRGGSKR